MSEPPTDTARDVVERYERDIALPADVQERIAARLAASIATDVAPAPVAPAEGWRSPRVVWMGVAVAAAALLLLWTGLRVTTGLRDEDPDGMSAPHQRAPEDRVRQAVPRRPETHATASAPRPSPASTAAAPAVEATPVAAPQPHEQPAPPEASVGLAKQTAPTKRSRQTDEQPVQPEQPTPGASSLQPELASLEAVRQSLRSDPPATTLGKATAHRKAFPHGLLAREARALEIIARCRAGQHERGHAAARAFAEAFPASTLVPRIEEACDLEATE